jgi:hypothetical protein
MASLDRSSGSPMFDIFLPSISISPAEISIIRNKLSVRDDLPLPVRPHIPIWNYNIS